MDADQERTPGRVDWARVAGILIPVTAILIVILGTAIILVAGSEASFGWFAYAPLSNTTFLPEGIVYLGASSRVGMALCGVGLVVLAFWMGYRTGRRRRP